MSKRVTLKVVEAKWQALEKDCQEKQKKNEDRRDKALAKALAAFEKKNPCPKLEKGESYTASQLCLDAWWKKRDAISAKYSKQERVLRDNFMKATEQLIQKFSKTLSEEVLLRLYFFSPLRSLCGGFWDSRD